MTKSDAEYNARVELCRHKLRDAIDAKLAWLAGRASRPPWADGLRLRLLLTRTAVRLIMRFNWGVIAYICACALCGSGQIF
jgi:hypothetical protein